MVLFTILAGGYGAFVATYLFDSTVPSLTLESQSSTGPNPSWISLDINHPNLLYAVNEATPGQLQSFSINGDGSLSDAIDTVTSGGNGPAFATALSNGSVAVMNYGSGNGRIIPTSVDGKNFDHSEAVAPVITFTPPKGGVSHPHMALEYGDEVFVPDLGADKVWRLKEQANGGGYQIEGFILQPNKSGPRHIAIYNERLFTLHELSSMLSVQSIPDSPSGSATTFANVSIVPSDLYSAPGAVYAAAEILIPKPCTKFPKPYIYVSNRNIGNQTEDGDTIAIFEHVNQDEPNEGLVLIKQVSTGLDQIRGMQFGNEENGGEEYLMAGGVAGTAGVVVLQRTDEGRNLEFVVGNKDIPTRTSFVWL